jgi:hypothetical protein
MLMISILTMTPKHQSSKQIERDASQRYKSYQALEQIVLSIYKNDPNGSAGKLRRRKQRREGTI